MFEEKNNDNNPFSNDSLNSEEGQEQEAVTEETQKEERDFEAEIDALNNKYLRLAADFDNYRKRQAQERENLLKYGAEETLKKIITVLDTFERAQKAFETVEDCEKVKEGFNVSYNQLLDALSKAGLEKIETEGKEFDPNFHEAVMQTPSKDHKEHQIITQMQSGYKLGDRVLRPAFVNVAVNSEE